ncbi:MAG: TIGR03032 family protein [Isosphaeraceae bacterium]
MTTRGLSPSSPPAEGTSPLRAVHSTSFPGLLRRLNVSLLVTTYQAGKLVIVRDDGDHLNTHFRSLAAPMGLALDGGRLAIGTTIQVWEYADVPAVADRLEPAGRHDACFLPRASHVTGNILGHEMAYGAGGELWIVNTRFSCLCTLDRSASFTPRWRPPFVSALEPTDRCHLNGLGMVDGRPRFVTALGESDGPAGWRPNKARGGILMDVASGEVIARGLSMPHSPRWHGGRLWVCESGSGTLGIVDPGTGRYEPIAAMPGFTRGLDLVGGIAFVGLSQVRESAVFSGIPITERLPEEGRACGVCAVDLATGGVVAVLRFEEAVQEVFAVAALPGRRWPELINDDEAMLSDSFVLPDAALADVPPSLRSPSRPDRYRGAQSRAPDAIPESYSP